MDKLSEPIGAHPDLFRGKPPAFASELPAGWFDIVDALCRDIEALLGSEPDRFVVTQIKEKLGGLRFYFSLEGVEDMFVDMHTDRSVRTIVNKGDGPPLIDELRSLVAASSLRSTITCQDCAAPGLRAARGGWVGTLCALHAQDWDRQRESDKE